MVTQSSEPRVPDFKKEKKNQWQFSESFISSSFSSWRLNGRSM
jgi:hypothetical protein